MDSPRGNGTRLRRVNFRTRPSSPSIRQPRMRRKRPAVGRRDKLTVSIIMAQSQTINRVELQGHVGSVRKLTYGEREALLFSVATNRVYRDSEGTPVIETTWHSCTAWDGEGICPLDGITKGVPVHLTGRIRNTRYTGKDDAERVATEIVAETLEVVKL